MSMPSEKDAISVVESFKHISVKSIKRFTTGNHHYVYDIVLENNEQLVARMTTQKEIIAMEGAVHWNKFFYSKGIMLPELFFYDLEYKFPYMLIERLEGKDLGFFFDDLSDEILQALASKIGKFQDIAKKSVESNLFGFSVYPERAPFHSWIQVVENSLARSRKRIEKSKVISINTCVKAIELVCSNKLLINKPSITFFHDLTSKNVIISDKGELFGIVDVDDLCFGDPTYHLALTKVALGGRLNCDKYINYLIQSYGGYDQKLLNTYLAVFYLDFLSEIGQEFNGNVVNASPERIDFLKKSLERCLN